MQQAYKINLLSLLIYCFASLHTLAKDDPNYAVSAIPKDLLNNANAVVRKNATAFEVFSESKARETVKYAVTILKDGAIDMSIISLTYDKLFKISALEGTIYDANGKKVRKIKNDEIQDISAVSGSTLYTDNRIKYIDPEYYTYPFTIEYTYTKDYNTLFFMPRWLLFDGYNVAIEKSSLKAIVPNDYKLRFYESKIKAQVTELSKEEKTSYTWSSENIEALMHEPLSPSIREIVPYVNLAASKFEMDGIQGSLETWNDLGIYMGKLIDNRDQLPESTILEITKLVENIDKKETIIETIYKYTQKKNRYISIQEGVGGWQPFDAETVDRLSYGDCKALSNYTKSLLGVVGINAYYTRIYAGNRSYSAPKDFSINAFNHVILCVPCEKDTIWLECTSSEAPCGYMSDFTDDRYALIVKENGGEYVKTPSYSAMQNQQTTKGLVTFNDKNGLDINAQIKYTGANYGDVSYLLHRNEKDRRKRIINDINIPNFNLINYNLDEQKTRTPSITKQLDIEATNYCSKLGDRTLIKLNLFNAFSSVPRHIRGRKTPVYIQRNFSECDTIEYELPGNLTVEALPKHIELNTKYGTYNCYTKLSDSKITYYRYFQINKGTYPKEEYSDFREFLEKVSVADNATTSLIPKT